MNTSELYQEIKGIIAVNRARVEQFEEIDERTLGEAPKSGSWCALECIEHLNRTYELYLPRMVKAIHAGQQSTNDTYSAGWLGQYMIKGIAPTEAGERKQRMKTFRFFEPDISGKTKADVLQAYQAHLGQLETLLDESKGKNWNRIRVTSAIGPVIRFKLGDCFQFLLAHESRHLLQADEALAAVEAKLDVR